MIAPVTKDEQAKFEAIHFKMQDVHDAVGADIALSDNTVKTVCAAKSEGDADAVSSWAECVS